MAIAYNSKIVTDGLVFAYDMGNRQKSWRGKPTVNLQLPNIINWTNSAIVTLLPELSPIGTPVYSVTDNNNATYLSCTRNFTIPNDSNAYTISVFIKKTFGATSTRLGFNASLTGGTSVGVNSRFNSDTGVGNVGSTEDLGTFWRWQFSLTNNSTGNTTLNCSFYPATGFYDSGDNAAALGTAVVSSVQIEQNTFATSFVDGTRSDTQAVIDLVGNNTLTATSLTYASDNTFSFNGSSNFITVSGSAISGNAARSVFAWIKTSVGGRCIYSSGTATTGQAFNLVTYGSSKIGVMGFNNDFYPTTGATVTDNIWHYVGAVANGTGGITTYVDGILDNTGSITYSTVGQNNFVGKSNHLGSEFYWNGSISGVTVHNRALTAAEVAQNFNALRGRYGV